MKLLCLLGIHSWEKVLDAKPIKVGCLHRDTEIVTLVECERCGVSTHVGKSSDFPMQESSAYADCLVSLDQSPYMTSRKALTKNRR